MDAFDSDALIYAVVPDHPLGRRVRAQFRTSGRAAAAPIGIGSVLLIPEVLTKPTRDRNTDEVRLLAELLVQLDLRNLDESTAFLATQLGTRYRLETVDAVHLATAVGAGADRFITNNTRDFPKTITEIDITYPDDLESS